MEHLKDSFSALVTVIHVASNLHVQSYISKALHEWPVPFILIPGGSQNLKYDAFSASQAALCTSGTVAVELQLARLPCVVAYRAHFLTEWFIRYKAKISYISLPNILLDSAIIPEALFQACNPTNLAALLMKLVHNEGSREEQVVSAEKIIRLLWPSERTVDNLAGRNMYLELVNHAPSTVAASVMLSYVKP